MKDILRIENLEYKNIFHEFNFNIPNNSFISISGTNKCGKTTLLKILSGNIKTSNNVILNRAYIESYPINELYKEIGTVFPSDNINFVFNTVEDELIFILDNLGYEKEEKKKRYKHIIKLLKLNKFLFNDPNKLYRNLKIKVELAIAVIAKPKILILDDICSTMTKEETKEIMEVLKYLNDEENMTIVMSTDNLEETLYSDYLYIMKDGKVVLEGKPLDVLQKDNILNKVGLNLPFIVDLCVKLKDYNLIKDIELDMDKLVNILWK